MSKQILIVAGILSFVLGWLTVPARPQPPARFDKEVRADFFAGFAGDADAMKRGMAAAEQAIKENPKHAPALAWHGAGLLFLAGRKFEAGDQQEGIALWMTALGEMDKAVELEPSNIGVRIPRGASVLTASHFTPEEQVRGLLTRALADYGAAMDLQKERWSELSEHAKGELLIGLADANDRMGNRDESKSLFTRLTAEMPETAYGRSAKTWLAGGTLGPRQRGCLGCHASAK